MALPHRDEPRDRSGPPSAPAPVRDLPSRPFRGADASDERNPLDDVASPGASALEQLIGAERDTAVARAVATLPAPYRMALVLRDLQDLSYEEVADVLGCRVGTVKSRINRARNLLRDKLNATRGVGMNGVTP